MTTETASATTGGVAALGAILIQNNPSPPTTLLVPVLSAVIGAAISYAVLKTTVQKMEHDVRDMRKDLSEIYTLLRESMTNLARLEGRVDASNH